MIFIRFAESLSKKNRNFELPPLKAVFLGDSVTHGVFEIFRGKEKKLECIFDFKAVYHEQLKNMLNSVFPAVPVNIINAGISGGSAPQGYERLKRDVLSCSPDLVVVCFGLNDAHGGTGGINNYTEALRNIFKVLKSKDIEAIFLTPNMMNTYVSPAIKDQYIAEISEITAKLQNDGVMDFYMDNARRVCKEEGILVCDCYEKWKQLYKIGADITALLSNYINHPTREMHRLFAEALFDMIMFD